MKKSVFILMLALILFIPGCIQKTPQNIPPTEQHYEIRKLDDYLTSVREQAATITASLEKDPLTQTDMNVKSQELYKLWDDALNYVWDELKGVLSEEQFANLQDEQRTWETEKESAEDRDFIMYSGFAGNCGTLSTATRTAVSASVSDSVLYYRQ